MKNYLLLLMMALLSTSCVDFDGNFVANEKISLIHTTIFGNERVKTLRAGQYQTEVGFSSEDKLKLSFSVGGNEELDVKIKLPEDRQFPSTRGEIFVGMNETGQRYDIEGYLDTQYSRSRVRDEVESCTYVDRSRRVCRRVCRGGPRSRVCRNVCTNEPTTRYGHRRVRYYYEYTDRTLDLSLIKPNGSAAARYNGTDRSSSKVYEYQGICR